MSLYTVTIENRKYVVQIIGDQCTVNGVPVKKSFITRHVNGLQVLRYENRFYEFFLSEQGTDTYQLLLRGGRRVISHIVDSARKRLHAKTTEGTDKFTKAPMHGLVVDVKVRAGQQVEAGDVMVVLESMKMQMQICAARSATVAVVHASKGQQVEKDTRLVEFKI